MLKKRVITALCGLPLLIIAVWFDEPLPWFTIFVAIWGLLAVFEFYRLVAVSEVRSLTAFGLLWTLLFILSPHFDYDFTVPLLLTSAIVLSLVWLVLYPQKEGVFLGWVWAIAGILYVGWLLSFLVVLRLDAGRNWAFFALFTTFGSETIAFFVGRALGRHHLAPSISPNKTWEGYLAGVVFGTLGTVGLAVLWRFGAGPASSLSAARSLILGVTISALAPLGDLGISMIKRETQIKDTGTLLPGHGGILDRLDSWLWAAAIGFYMVSWLTA